MSTPTGDKRSVATDALETLGTIIDETQKRDAIHLAVEPVIAGQDLWPAADIRIIDGKAFRAQRADAHGIVDPFLSGHVTEGSRFWFVMYPRMVHSLRHVWTHPAFPDEAGTPAPAPKTDDKAASETWLRDWCTQNDVPGYEPVMAVITSGKWGDGDSYGRIEDGYIYFNGVDAHASIPDEFWNHVEIVTGRKFAPDERAESFSCSC